MRKRECEDDLYHNNGKHGGTPQFHISYNSEEGDGVPQALAAKHLVNTGSASGRRPDPPAVRAAASLPFDFAPSIGWWVLRMCSSGCPLTCYVYQAALELMAHPPVCLPSASITGMGHYIFLAMRKATDHKTAL